MTVLTTVTEGYIATVTLQVPTMAPEFFREVREAFDSLARMPELRAVVLRSTAKAFSYGLDLRAAMTELGPHLAGGLAGQRAQLHELIRELQDCFTAVARCPVPTIAAVHGRCIGGGLDLVTACDMRLASADANFSLRETKIAIVADLGSLQRLPLIVGKGHAREMAFTGRDVDAAEAERIGLCNRTLPDRDALHTAAAELAAEIASNAPLTVRGVKDVLDYGEDKSVDDGLRYVAAWNSAFLASADLGEAMAAFAAKREPEFKGA